MRFGKAYYNEHDEFAAAWLRELIKQGHIADGVVDERSIEDVLPSELEGFTQCHFFAGVGIWSYALRQAGWGDDRRVWTGSCPCQPFSAAGKGDGFDDERHLWPAFHHLIEQCKPDVVFGEQVASKDGLAWLDLVLADLEGTGYAAGAVDTCSAGFGAPHIRQRLYWMADLHSNGRSEGVEVQSVRAEHDAEYGSGIGGLEYPQHQHKQSTRLLTAGFGHAAGASEAGGLENSELPTESRLGLVGRAAVCEQEAGGLAGTSVAGGLRAESGSAGLLCGEELGGLGDTEHDGRVAATLAGSNGSAILDNTGGTQHTEQFEGTSRPFDVPETLAAATARPTNGHWRDVDWLFCRDGKWRPVRPGSFPLAHGAAARVGRLRGYGNALNAEAAKAFIEAYLEANRESLLIESLC